MWTLASRHSTMRPSSQIHPSRSSKVWPAMALSSLWITSWVCWITSWFGFGSFGLGCKSSIVDDPLAKPSNYVNIADLMSAPMPPDPAKADPTAHSRPELGPMYELIELFFFAYRDFVGDADRLLEAYGFGRAHHRVLYFVTRRPGLTIAELLEILRITKQSLNRVLRELVDKNFVETRAGALDRRRRQLYATAEGERSGVAAGAGSDTAVCRRLGDFGQFGPAIGDGFSQRHDRSSELG